MIDAIPPGPFSCSLPLDHHYILNLFIHFKAMLHFFDHIVLPAPRDRIFKQLGFRRNITRLGEARKQETESYIDEALSLIHLKGVGRRVLVREITDSSITLEEGTVFPSRHLATFLRSCREILLMGATAGSEIVKVIGEDTVGVNVTRGVVFDATASEMVDGALDWIMAFYKRELRREGRSVPSARFSAGYGDFLLENQRSLYCLLQFNRIGVDITERCLLVPEKSVTAITGIH